MATRRNVQYSHIPMEDINGDIAREEADDNLRFTYTPKSHMRIPWKSIALALFLLLVGILLLSLSYFIFANHMEGDGSQAYGLLFLVCLLSFLDIMRLELLTTHGEEHKGTLLHPSRIISCLCFSIESVKRQLGQAPGQLIEPRMELSELSRLQAMRIGNISSKMVMYS